MHTERDFEMQAAISNMLSVLEKQIREPLTENNQRTIFKTIHRCLEHLANNKENIKELH
jgi:hypothetical protein